MFTIILQILGALGVFLYGLQVMSEGLQKAAGTRLRSVLSGATQNRFAGTLSGFVVTCAVQSSSATTVMIVAFCSAGLLTLTQSLGVIFGANIGTTTTAWLVSLLGFKVKISAFALPLIGLGFFSQFIRRWSMPHKVGQVLVGFGLLFLGLDLLKDALPDAKNDPSLVELLSRLEPGTFSGLLLAVLFGAVLTAVVQSSSASMAITLTAAAKGYIDFPTACAIALGQNIGTTITAVIATIGAPLVARRAALAHFLFNFLGSVWPILLLNPFLALVDDLVPGNPYLHSEKALLAYIPTHIAAFHTAFNVINTGIFLAFLAPFERLVIRLLPQKEGVSDETDLLYLETAFGSTPEIAIEAAAREVDRMAGVTERMLVEIRAVLEGGGIITQEQYEQILRDEDLTDVLEHKITEYLAALVHGHLSTASSHEALSLLSMINDLERIGDHGEKVAGLLKRSVEKSTPFSKLAYEELIEMVDTTANVIAEMRKLILRRDDKALAPALEREQALDELRHKFRKSHLRRLQDGECDAMAGLIFSDLLSSFEKMGDHAFNVVEATLGHKIHPKAGP